MSNNKVYWRGTEELEKDPAFVKNADKEFSEELPIDKFLSNKDLDSTNTSRRDFLKFMGFGITAATLAACETPVVKSMPYVVKPDEVMPGIANYYASTHFDGYDYASILVKTREGRPIHIEGNKLSKTAQGGVSARVNSSILSLYNKRRFTGPMKEGQSMDWATMDGEIAGLLNNVKNSGGNVRFLSSTMISPSSMSLIGEFKTWMESANVPLDATEEAAPSSASVNHVMYDAVSSAAMIEANKNTHGIAAIPSYHFEKAKVIVSFGADFLINWINPIGFARDYANGRNPEGGMSKHYQFETVMSTTGSNADIRGAIKPSEQGAAVAMLGNAIAGMMGNGGSITASLVNDDNQVESKLKDAASKLVAAKGSGLVISDSNDPNVQAIVNGINEMLGNIGSTIDFSNTMNLRKGSDTEVAALIGEMNAGAVDLLFVMDADPAYTLPSAWGFSDAMAKVKNVVSFAEKPDATSQSAKYICPVHHFLESWNDANPFGNEVTFAQPTINPINNTRQWQDSVLTWMGSADTYYDVLKRRWDAEVTATDDPSVIFASKWNKVIQDGVGSMPMPEMAIVPVFNAEAVSSAASALSKPIDGWEVAFYVKAGIGIGSNADNPWLQELPDPVTKVVWDQYVAMNPADMMSDAFQLNTLMGEQQRAGMVRVTVNDASVELPVVSVPGQKRGTIGVALGYGKGYEGDRLIGENAFAMLPVTQGYIRYSAPATVEKIERRYNIASTQTQHTMMGRKILNETTFSEFKSEGREHWNPVEMLNDAYGNKVTMDKLDLWAEHDIDLGHRWGLSIDLSTCIGCGACVTACHSENNVPIVGKDEVNRTRSMSWIRIDRYYSSDADPEIHGGIDQDKDYQAMEIPSEYPEVGYMPVMCQHCNHAPCETVCPVAATTHSDEGYNQMTYNRCIGTRYCANNCPYKVRRFNWFNYIGDSKFADLNPSQDNLARMVLNPDVVVRSRGVMEKCSLCVQRVQAGKLDAKKAGTPVKDGSIQTACSSACPTNAIAFGDINDKGSNVRSQAMNDRAYHLLEEVGVKPNVWYQTKVRNSEHNADHTA
ncbi:MAG: TAT-variant-translocated molybdopterin oxidoreductase [Flavobacteriales bacterium]|nr:TAT-variant-translocated molybdopterin oxidoreductase [Flavobacteriales bacterium]